MKERIGQQTGIGRQNSEFISKISLKIRNHYIRHFEFNWGDERHLGYLSILANKLVPIKKSKNEILHAGDISLTPFISDKFDIIEIWDMMPFEEFNLYQNNFISAFIFASYIPPALSADIIVAHTEESKKIFLSFFGDKEVYVIPAGIDTDFFRIMPNIVKESRSVLAIAAGYPQENLVNLVKGCGESGNVILRIIGDRLDANERKKLFSIASKYKDLALIFIGYVSDEKLREYYNFSSVYCSASFKEGFGLTPVEAMACGTVPVLSKIDPHIDTAWQRGIFFNPKKPDEIADSLNMAFDYDIVDRIQLRESALEYSWSKVIPKWLSLYESLGVDIK